MEPFFNALYVCNPISSKYIELHCPKRFFIPRRLFIPHSVTYRPTYEFGVSKISGQHKVVQIIPHSDCHVYTLGTESWRRVEAAHASFSYGSTASGAFVNGNLHWLVLDSNDSNNAWIFCFDLEAECFSRFSVPGGIDCTEKVSALRDCLCLCDHTSDGEMVIVIWLMKEYGYEKSWTKEYVINLNSDFHRIGYEFVYPIKVFQDGDMLMIWDELLIFYYNTTKTSREIGVFDKANSYLDSVLLTPSFLPLKSFGMENVISL